MLRLLLTCSDKFKTNRYKRVKCVNILFCFVMVEVNLYMAMSSNFGSTVKYGNIWGHFGLDSAIQVFAGRSTFRTSHDCRRRHIIKCNRTNGDILKCRQVSLLHLVHYLILYMGFIICHDPVAIHSTIT